MLRVYFLVSLFSPRIGRFSEDLDVASAGDQHLQTDPGSWVCLWALPMDGAGLPWTCMAPCELPPALMGLSLLPADLLSSEAASLGDSVGTTLGLSP